MSDAHPRGRSLESLKKEAKRWLGALRSGDPDARRRLERAIPETPANPTLRDVQHALAREHGFDGWTSLTRAAEASLAESRAAVSNALARYEEMAESLLDAYRTGSPEAMERLYRFTWHRRSWQAFRSYVQLDLGKRPTQDGDDTELTLDDARFLVAVDQGFHDWSALVSFTRALRRGKRLATKPVRITTVASDEPVIRSRDWDEILEYLAQHPGLRLDAGGQMTDEMLGELARVGSVAALELGGSQRVSDAGIAQIAGLRTLRHLNLAGTGVTDQGLAAISELTALESIGLQWTAITDEGARVLAHCHQIERVELLGTRTGDGALAALAGKERLRELFTGDGVTDAGLALLRDIPAFSTWRGGEPAYSLTSYRASPNYLGLRGRFTDRGMEQLRGLDGVFALNLDDSRLNITAAALEPLVTLRNLGWLAVDAKDDWMPWIARMPNLRFLGAQDTTAGDDGWLALSASTSIEVIWGRRCHNLRTRGFRALGTMPSLRALSVSCLNVEDEGVAALPSFPLLRELMPIDVPDAGYRHIGRCNGLESLVLMYCRDTTDAATEHITGLSSLAHYFNSYTTITDRTPELLSTMPSLERITFDGCHNLTNAGIARLVRLPRLRELRVSGRGVTVEVASDFAPAVSVHVGE